MVNLAYQILRAPENIFYQAIARFQPEWAEAVWTGIDAGLTYAERTSPYFNRNLYLHRIFSNVLHTGWMVWNIKIILQQNNISHPWIPALLALGSGPLSHFVLSKIRQKSSSIDTPQELKQKLKAAGVTLSYSLPDSQAYGHAMYVSRIVVNMLLACLSPPHRLWAGLNILGSSYNFLKNWQVKWLKFSREFHFDKVPFLQQMADTCYTDRIRFDYLVPLVPNPNSQSQCLTCLEDNPPFSFCFPHATTDLTCLIGQIFTSSQHFRKGLQRYVVKTDHYHNHRYTGTTYTAKLTIPQSNLPKCLECNNYPANHSLSAQYFDQNRSRGHFTTTLSLTPDSKAPALRFFTFETWWARLGTIYSSFQAGLALMQQCHPDLATTIAEGQKILSLFDLGALVHHYRQLYSILYDKYVIKKAEQDKPQDQVNKTNQAVEQARLEQSQLKNSIEEAIEKGKILKITHYRIPLSEQGRTLLEEVKQAIDRKEIVDEQGQLRPTHEESKALFEKFLDAHEEGDIILVTHQPIPLSCEAVSLYQKMKKHLKTGEIQVERYADTIKYISTKPEIRDVIQNSLKCYENCELVNAIKGFIPLTAQAQDILLNIKSASDQGSISWQGNGRPQFKDNGEQIYNQFIAAITAGEIVPIESGTLIPLTPQTSRMLSQQRPTLQTFQDACNRKEQAERQANQSHSSLQQKYHRLLHIGIFSGGALLAIASPLIVNFLNKKLKPIDLSEVLKNIASPADFKNMKIGWCVPWVPYLGQCLIAHRLFVSLILAIFSPDKGAYTCSALFQAATLYNLAKLPYVTLERTFFNPVRNVSHINVSFDMLLPLFHPVKSKCSSLATHVESNIKAVYTYTTQFLNKSSWTCWLTTNQYGAHVSTHYNVNLQTTPLEACSCTIKTIFQSITGRGHDTRYGGVAINFSYPR